MNVETESKEKKNTLIGFLLRYLLSKRLPKRSLRRLVIGSLMGFFYKDDIKNEILDRINDILELSRKRSGIDFPMKVSCYLWDRQFCESPITLKNGKQFFINEIIHSHLNEEEIEQVAEMIYEHLKEEYRYDEKEKIIEDMKILIQAASA